MVAQRSTQIRMIVRTDKMHPYINFTETLHENTM